MPDHKYRFVLEILPYFIHNSFLSSPITLSIPYCAKHPVFPFQSLLLVSQENQEDGLQRGEYRSNDESRASNVHHRLNYRFH